MLRYLAWKCLSTNEFKHKQACIVTGPGEDLAIKLIKRMKDFFPEQKFDTKEKVIILNDCYIQAYAAGNMYGMRSLVDAKFILLDEADFFEPAQQTEAIDVAERYIAKSDPIICLVSTPNKPGGLFERIENDPKSIYHKVFMPWQVGENKIYSKLDIQHAMLSSSFQREYGLSYGHGLGNVLQEDKINACLRDSYEVSDLTIQSLSIVSIGVDIGFGSSMSSYTVTAMIDNKVVVLEADQFERPEFNWFTSLVFQKYRQYNASKIFVDAASPSLIVDLKTALRERTDYEKQIAQATHDKMDYMVLMTVVPVPFNKYGMKMLDNLILLVNDCNLIIPKKFDKLIQDMRIANVKNGKLDKSTNTLDLLDSLRLSTFMYNA